MGKLLLVIITIIGAVAEYLISENKGDGE